MNQTLVVQNRQLRREIAIQKLSRDGVIKLGIKHHFPIELIDRMPSVLEDKLLEILLANRAEESPRSIDSIDCDSTDQLKILFRDKYLGEIFLTDKFMLEYYERVATGLSDRQLAFYDKIFRGLR